MRAIRRVRRWGLRVAHVTVVVGLSVLGLVSAAFPVTGPVVRAQAPPAAGGYMFSLISIGPPGCGGPLNGNPVMNNEGLVAYTDSCGGVALGDGFQQDLLVGAPGGCTGNPCLTGFYPQLSINDARTVAIQAAFFDNPTASIWDAILTAAPGSPGAVVRLREEDTPYQGFFDPRINNLGVISLTGLTCTPSCGNGVLEVLRLDGGLVTVVFDEATPTPLGFVKPGRYTGINDSGLVGVSGSNPGSLLTTDGLSVTVIDAAGNGGILSLNNDGVLAYVNSQQQVAVGDGGPVQIIARSSATDPQSPFQQFYQTSINNDGGVAFLASTLAGNYAISTGPDFVADKVVQTGDVLPIVPGGFQVQLLRFSSEGFNDVGQVAFFANDVNGRRVVVRADPPGSTPANPILPADPAPPWRFPDRFGRARAGWGRFYDPHLAIGYRYEVSGPGASNFASVVIPAPLPQGDGTFEVSFAGQSAVLTAGVPFDFTAFVSGGVPEFTITGIDEAELLDPDDPTAFVTGLTFVDAFDGEMIMTPLTELGDDTTPPVLALPIDIATTATSPDGRLVAYAVTATDDNDPAPVVTCDPPSGTTFPIGTTTVNCSATDASGNGTSGTFDVTVAYDFVGFLSPVSNAPAVNSAKAGSSVPVKFSLVGDMGLDVFAPGFPASQTTTCDGGASTTTIAETATAGQSSLSYDPLTDEYTYVWKTSKAWVGTCLELLLTLRDGTTRTARFAFPK